MRLGIVVFVVAAAVSSCQSGNISKRSISSIPMEGVDVETNGQKGGDTHFHVGPGEVFLSYETLDSPLSANQKIEERKAKALQVIEEGPVPDGAEAPQGVYLLVVNASPQPENTRFCLYWSKAARYHSACSASIEPIEHFRALYEL